jgi:Outer membrane protein beta-barrel domain
MRTIVFSIVIFSAASSAFSQQWEFGAVGGGGFLSNVSAKGAAGNAITGFAPGAAFGAFLGNSLNRNISGEIHYEYLQNNLRLSSGGQTAQFAGASQTIHYDVVYHTSRKESNVQFFAALGGGVKLFRGTGAEAAYQPLSQFGYFTRTQAIKPMIGVGGGFTYRLSNRLFLRAEIRDFITPFPTAVLTPAPGVKFGSVLQALMPMLGLSYVY